MITHLSLVGHTQVTAEVRRPPIETPDIGDVVTLYIGPALAIHMPVEQAEDIADTIIEAIADRNAAMELAGPVAFVPVWAGLG